MSYSCIDIWPLDNHFGSKEIKICHLSAIFCTINQYGATISRWPPLKTAVTLPLWGKNLSSPRQHFSLSSFGGGEALFPAPWGVWMGEDLGTWPLPVPYLHTCFQISWFCTGVWHVVQCLGTWRASVMNRRIFCIFYSWFFFNSLLIKI